MFWESGYIRSWSQHSREAGWSHQRGRMVTAERQDASVSAAKCGCDSVIFFTAVSICLQESSSILSAGLTPVIDELEHSYTASFRRVRM